MNDDLFPPWSLWLKPVGGMCGDGTADGAGVLLVRSERGDLTACRGFGNSATGTPPVSGPLDGAYGSCSECLQ
jgi:hypothetical protein